MTLHDYQDAIKQIEDAYFYKEIDHAEYLRMLEDLYWRASQ